MSKSVKDIQPGEVFRTITKAEGASYRRGEPCLMLRDRTVVRLLSLDTHEHLEDLSLMEVHLMGPVEDFIFGTYLTEGTS